MSPHHFCRGLRIVGTMLLLALAHTVRAQACGPIVIMGPQPTLRAFAGDNVTMRVTVPGLSVGDVGYQWLKDGAPVAAATSDSLRLAGLLKADKGCYQCTVVNTVTGCADTSDTCVLTVLDPAVMRPSMDTTPFYTFDLLRDMADASCDVVIDSSLGEHFGTSFNDTDYLVDTAHAPGGKPFVINLQRKHCVQPRMGWGCSNDTVCSFQQGFSGCDSCFNIETGDSDWYCWDYPGGEYCYEYCTPGAVIGQVSFRVNSSTPRHASALYLAANTAGYPSTTPGPVTEMKVRFETPLGDTVEFSYMLTHRRDLRNWAVGDTANPFPVAPLDSNANWHQLDSGNGYYMDVVRIPFPDSLLPAHVLDVAIASASSYGGLIIWGMTLDEDFRIPCTVLAQNTVPWAGIVINYPKNTNLRYTVGGYGCTITSWAMLLEYGTPTVAR